MSNGSHTSLSMSDFTDHKDLTVALGGDQFFIPTNSESSNQLSDSNGGDYPFLHMAFTLTHLPRAVQAVIVHTSVVILWAY
jgi:hypothetical protein